MQYATVFAIDTVFASQASQPDSKQPLDDQAVQYSIVEEGRQVILAEQLTHVRHTGFTAPVAAVLAELEQKPVGACWLAMDYFDERELGYVVQLTPHQQWLFGARVDKAQRGRGIFAGLLEWTRLRLGGQNVTTIFAAVNPLNQRSMKAFGAQSRRVAGRLLVVRLLSMSCCLARGSCRANRTVTLNCERNPIEIHIG